ncbi:10563_t:CDS:2 [Rhizophagus irregularis]|nr:10563_t:CDS:2 [Rhizophagus irregularis]
MTIYKDSKQRIIKLLPFLSFIQMEKYFQSASNSKGKRKEGDNIEHPIGDSSKSHKKIQNKKYKKERNDWDPKWPQTYPWLMRREDEEENPFMYCVWCEEGKVNNIFTKGCNKFKKDYLDNHIKTDTHSSIAKLRNNTNQPNIIAGFVTQLGVEKSKIITLMRNAYFCSKHNLALNIYPDLNNLVEYQIKNYDEIHYQKPPTKVLPPPLYLQTLPSTSTSSNYATYKNSKAGLNFIESFSCIIERQVIDKINKSTGWSILLDESTTITIDKHLAIISKHIVGNEPVLRYLGMINLEECDANSITKDIEIFLNAKGISFKSLFHIGSDGASVMTAHRFALVGKDSANDVPYFKEYESTLKRLYSYFSRSYNRLKNLRMIQADDDDDPGLAILKLVSTRWLSLSQTVSNLHQTLNSIISSLQTDILVNDDGADLAKKLLEELDPNFILATKFLADLFDVLQRLIKAFQGDFITLSDVHYHLNSTILAIQTMFIGDDNTPPTYGKHLLEYIESNNLSISSIPNSFSQFSSSIIQNIEKRFPDSDFHYSMRIFDAQQLPLTQTLINQYGEKEIEIVGEFYGNQKTDQDGNIYEPIIDKKELKNEWIVVRQFIANFRESKFVEQWFRIFSTTDFSTLYPNISKIIHIILIIPLSNASVERVFSRQNLIKSKLRNKMKLETLYFHLNILINGPSLNSFDFEAAYNYWAQLPRSILM